MKNVSFRISAFAELDIYRLYDIMCLRDRVFVVGQGITAESELDGRDIDAWHVECHDGEKLVATNSLICNRGSPSLLAASRWTMKFSELVMAQP